MENQSLDRVRIESAHISDVGCFQDISLSFSSRFNLLCGANGVGKSTVLAILGRAFSHHRSELRRRAASEKVGKWSVQLNLAGSPMTVSGVTEGLMPHEQDQLQSSAVKASRSLLYFKATRDFLYRRLANLTQDERGGQSQWSHFAIAGVDQADLKRWLVNRYMFSVHQDALTPVQLADLEFAKTCFSILDERVRFSDVEASTFDVYVTTPQGRIPFEYLSSGFRASLAMLVGIIREIEHRDFSIPATEFNGVVLIDELDLHLHPSWQRLIVPALKNAFPAVQFIVTTHSPHMIQIAEFDEVIALIADDEGTPRVGKFDIGPYSFKGWTIEEILRDVMGLTDTESSDYKQAMRSFDEALDKGDSKQVARWLGDLESMLHPSNHLRKLLRLQAARVEQDDDDQA